MMLEFPGSKKSRFSDVIWRQEKDGNLQGRVHSGNVFFEQYHSKRCWDTVAKARDRYKALKSETEKLAAVREQI